MTALGNKFWPYHQLPQQYFLAALAALALGRIHIHHPIALLCCPLLAVWLCLTIPARIHPMIAGDHHCLWQAHRPNCTLNQQRQSFAQAEQLAQFLRTHSRSDQAIAVLTTSSYGLAFPALLKAKREPALRTIEGFPFYHHTDSHYVQQLRREAMTQLRTTSPTWVLKPLAYFRPVDKNAEPFSELEQWLIDNYQALDQQPYPELSPPIPVTIFERRAIP